MSHTPPERDADSPAPGGAGNAWLRFFWWAMLALVVYVLSVGPAFWLFRHGYLSKEAYIAIYYPFQLLPPWPGGYVKRIRLVLGISLTLTLPPPQPA